MPLLIPIIPPLIFYALLKLWLESQFFDFVLWTLCFWYLFIYLFFALKLFHALYKLLAKSCCVHISWPNFISKWFGRESANSEICVEAICSSETAWIDFGSLLNWRLQTKLRWFWGEALCRHNAPTLLFLQQIYGREWTGIGSFSHLLSFCRFTNESCLDWTRSTR